ncbi:MAG: LCP family protein [Acetobacter sp.]|nr:LCP family protein [Bacteroides sp.]MCM1340379.1 LCP family protein [Acetobacter sp.]MCM1432974.1 LCP family protein [Clostridiales bacterium]
MEKETYDIDEILSEVRKRREEQEKKSNPDIEEVKQSAPEAEKKQEVEPGPPKQDVMAEEPSVKEQTADIPFTQNIIDSKKAEQMINSVKQENVIFENLEEVKPEAEKQEMAEKISDNDVNEEGMVDLFSISDDYFAEKELDEPKEKTKFFKTKKGKIIKAVIIILLVLILAVGAFAGVYIYNKINNMTENDDSKRPETVQKWSGMDKLEEEFPAIQETDASEIASLQDMVKTWYYNGEPCHSTHVLNVLLLGEDTRGDDILEEGTRADSAIIVSINIDTGKITLTSVLRDAYAYWETTKGDESTGMLGKINGAMSRENCNINTYINCIERLYKVDIDNYVIVNFDSFKKIIDAIGGVNLELTSAEINEINNHQKRYGGVHIDKTFDGSSGEMLLDGSQALAYCRIRYIDSDNMRADRQKTCLMAIYDKAKNESKATLLKMIDALLPYVRTGFSTKEVVNLAKYAFTENWLGYDINMTSIPYARIKEKGMGGSNYGEWMWRPDYPQDAHYLQTLLYGQTNITLAQTRVDVVKCENYGFYSEGSAPVTATIYNDAYQMPTTYEELAEEESTTSN